MKLFSLIFVLLLGLSSYGDTGFNLHVENSLGCNLDLQEEIMGIRLSMKIRKVVKIVLLPVNKDAPSEILRREFGFSIHPEPPVISNFLTSGASLAADLNHRSV